MAENRSELPNTAAQVSHTSTDPKTFMSGRELLGTDPHQVYKLLKRFEPGLMLDVGASNGNMTKMMLRNSPGSRVIAFEPYPGNYPIISKALEGMPNVELITKAATDQAGSVAFRVGLTSDEQTSDPTYSTLGHIVKAGDTRFQTIEVDTVTVDEVVGHQRVRFMKIDTQGGETAVLRSAARLLAEQRVDLIYAEWSAEQDLFDFIVESDLAVIDGLWSLVPLKDEPDLGAWEIVSEFVLSTGRSAFNAWPKHFQPVAQDMHSFLHAERDKIGNVFTDLVLVRRGFLEQFMSAAREELLEA